MCLESVELAFINILIWRIFAVKGETEAISIHLSVFETSEF